MSAAAPAPVSGDDGEAIAQLATDMRDVVRTGSSGITELAKGLIARGWSRSPAVQVDAATVLEDAAVAYERAALAATGTDVGRWLRYRAAALRSPSGGTPLDLNPGVAVVGGRRLATNRRPVGDGQ